MAKQTKRTSRSRSRNGHKRTRREFTIVIEQDADGWYVGSVPELRGCHTQARSLDALMDRVREAVDLCLDVERMDTGRGGSRKTQFIGVQRIAV